MRSSRTIKSRIAAIDKRLGDLPPLITLTLEKPDGSLEFREMDPLDACIVLIDAECAEYFDESPEEAESSQLRQFKKLDGRIVGAEITGNYDGESSGNLAPLRAMEFFESLQAFREERAQGALC